MQPKIAQLGEPVCDNLRSALLKDPVELFEMQVLSFRDKASEKVSG